MKKFLLALLFVISLSFASYASEDIDGVWGMKFGIAPEEARRVLSEKDAKIVCDYVYQPDYHEAIYQVNFFGRRGHMLLRFSSKGLYLVRFAFVRTETLRSEEKKSVKAEASSENRVIDARTAFDAPEGAGAPKKQPFEFSKNYVQLKSMLTNKYGPAREEFKEGGDVRGCRWSTGSTNRRSVTLYESRSFTKNDTSLTYEDSSRR